MTVESCFESVAPGAHSRSPGMLDHLVHVYEFREFGTCVRQLEADEFQRVQCSCLLAHTHCGPSHHSLEPTRRETPTLALRILDFVRKKIAVIGFCSSEGNPRWTCGNSFSSHQRLSGRKKITQPRWLGDFRLPLLSGGRSLRRVSELQSRRSPRADNLGRNRSEQCCSV